MNALLLVIHQFREQGWRRGGAVVRALTSHHFGPGSNPGVVSVCGYGWVYRTLDILASLAIWLLLDRSSYSNSVMSLWLQSTGLRYIINKSNHYFSITPVDVKNEKNPKRPYRRSLHSLRASFALLARPESSSPPPPFKCLSRRLPILLHI